MRSLGDHHRYHAVDRDAYTGVRAMWDAKGGGNKAKVMVGEGKGKGVKTPRTVFGSEQDAMQAASSEFARLQPGATTFALDLARDRPNIYPEAGCTVKGFKAEIDGTAWIVTRTEHRLDDNGFTTRVERENHVDAPPAARKLPSSISDADFGSFFD